MYFRPKNVDRRVGFHETSSGCPCDKLCTPTQFVLSACYVSLCRCASQHARDPLLLTSLSCALPSTVALYTAPLKLRFSAIVSGDAQFSAFVGGDACLS